LLRDGYSRQERVTGQLINSFDGLIEKGTKIGVTCKAPVGKSGDALIDKLYALRPSGSTALGPCLATAVGIAQSSPGSKIMICTDGMANCGVGSIEGTKDTQFYTRIASYARNKGVSISVVTMEGEDCSMENLGTVADITSGSVEIVDPLNLSSKIVTLLSKQMLASSVMCKLFLSNNLVFKTEDKGVLSKLVKEIGNVTVRQVNLRVITPLRMNLMLHFPSNGMKKFPKLSKSTLL
jgi:hypothetical protein